MNWLKTKCDDARGSVLVAGLVLVLVMTILGISLFDMGLLESRLVLNTQCDYQASETAQAGIKRSLRLLRLDLINDPNDPSWADGSIDGSSFPVTTDMFEDFPGLTNQSFANGNYSVQIKNLTRSEANGIGATCDADNDTAPCNDLIYVRSTGNCLGQTITSTRTVQLVTRANNNSPFGGGLLTGGPASGTRIIGNALIAGSLNVGCSAPPCIDPLDFTGTSGVRNNYNDMPALFQDRVPPLQLVTWPGTACAGQQVESLGAFVTVAEPKTTAAINLSGAGSLGNSGCGNNPYSGQPGKPTVDNVRLGDGCDESDCSDTVGGTAGVTNVFSDNPIKPHDIAAFPFPKLDDEITINSITYGDFAACPSAGNCDSAATNDFFISHAFKIVDTTEVDVGPNKQCPTPPPGKVCNLFNILTARTDIPVPQREKWDDQTPSFTKTFVCGAQCDDTSGNRVNGSVNGSKPLAFKIAWDEPGQLLTIYQCPVAPCDPGPPDFNFWQPLSHATQPVLPVMLYVDGPIRICKDDTAAVLCPVQTFHYQGHATFLARGDITIEVDLLTDCPSCPDQGGVGNDHDSFPQKNLLTFLTPGNINMGTSIAGKDMMGLFYAGVQWTTAFDTEVVGAITAGFIDMGSQVPKFFQVPELGRTLSERLFPVGGPRWSLTASNWKECQGTLGSGPC